MSAAVEYPASHDESDKYSEDDFEDDFESESVKDSAQPSEKSSPVASRRNSASAASDQSSAMPWDTHSSKASEQASSHKSNDSSKRSSAKSSQRSSNASAAAKRSSEKESAAAYSSTPATPSSNHSKRSKSSHKSGSTSPLSSHGAPAASADAADAAAAAASDSRPASSSMKSSRKSSAKSSASQQTPYSSSRKSASHTPMSSAEPPANRAPLSPGSSRRSSSSSSSSSSSEDSDRAAPSGNSGRDEERDDVYDEDGDAANTSAAAPAAADEGAYERAVAAAPSSKPTSSRSGRAKKGHRRQGSQPGYSEGESEGGRQPSRSRGGGRSVEPTPVPRTQQELVELQQENDRMREDIYQRQRELYHTTLSANKADTRRTMSRKETAAQHVREAVLLERVQQIMRREQKELLQQRMALREEVKKHRRALKYRKLVSEAQQDIVALKEENHDLLLEMRCNEKLLLMNANVLESGRGTKQLQEEIRSRNALLQRQAAHALRDVDDAERQRDAARDRVEVLQEQVDDRRGAASSDSYNDLQRQREENRERTRRVRELKAKVERLQASLSTGERQNTTGGGAGHAAGGDASRTHTHSNPRDAEREYLMERVEVLRAEVARLQESRSTRPPQQPHQLYDENAYGGGSSDETPNAAAGSTGASHRSSRSSAASRASAVAGAEDSSTHRYPTNDHEAKGRSPLHSAEDVAGSNDEVKPTAVEAPEDVALWLDHDTPPAPETMAGESLGGAGIDGPAAASVAPSTGSHFEPAAAPTGSSHHSSSPQATPSGPAQMSAEEVGLHEELTPAAASGANGSSSGPAWLEDNGEEEQPSPPAPQYEEQDEVGYPTEETGLAQPSSSKEGGDTGSEPASGAAENEAANGSDDEEAFEEESVAEDVEDVMDDEVEEEVAEEAEGPTNTGAAADAEDDETPDWLKF